MDKVISRSLVQALVLVPLFVSGLGANGKAQPIFIKARS